MDRPHSATDRDSLLARLEELRKENARLRLAEEKFEKLFSQAADSIFVLDIDDPEVPGKIIEANSRACEIHGYTREEMIGRSIRDIDTPESAEKAQERIARIRKGERLVFDVRHRRKDGSTFPIEVTAQALEIGGRRLAMAIDHELTLHPSGPPPDATRRHEALALLAEGLAHHFGNILQGIIGMLEVALKEPAGCKEKLALALSSCTRASQLIKKMGDLGGTNGSARRLVRMETLLRDIVPLCLRGEDISRDMSFADDIPPVRADSTRIGQAVWNILRNAAEAMGGAGSVYVEVRAEELVKDSPVDLPPGRYVVVSIRDTGPGLPPGAQETVFAPFFSTRPGSLGLGLTAALWTVERHGGTITAGPAPGRGTLLRLYLPASSDSA